MIIVAAVACGCGDGGPVITPLAEADRRILVVALERAVADSVALSRATLDIPVRLETSFGEDGRTVSSIETFRLTKRPGSDFAAVNRKQEVHGDRTLLESMYSFENSKGGLREDSEARFASIGFGADHRDILRDLLGGRLALRDLVNDTTADNEAPSRVVLFEGNDVGGSLELDSATLTTRRVNLRQSSSSIIGGYAYSMWLRLTDPREPVRLPVKMRTEFEFERITSSGAGVIQVDLDTAGSVR